MFGMKKETLTTTLTVEGMMCNMCKAHVEKALNALKGVASATADVAAKSVTVVHTEKVTPDAMKAAVTEAGYTVVG
ncbi:MAG: heavy-metal-associated domain-containing protein [Clostridia bacterium]|nr:heavy-metal-associated domain-containing protein [Clostridia bacterium]